MAAQPPKKPAPTNPPKPPVSKAPVAAKKVAKPPTSKPAAKAVPTETLPPPKGPTGVPQGAVPISMGRAPTISLTESVVLPNEWPPKQSNTMGLLSQAIGFVSSGHSVTPEFVDNLRRMLSSMEERMELVNVMFGHHQMHRLQKLHGAIEQVEAIVMNPDQIARMDPDQMLKLMQLLYSESNNVNKFIQEQTTAPPNPDTIHATVDPEKLAAAARAKEVMGSVPAQTRRAIREALATAIRNGVRSLPSKR